MAVEKPETVILSDESDYLSLKRRHHATHLPAALPALVSCPAQEWGKFDLKPQLAAYPRNLSFQSVTPDGGKGMAWNGKYGFAGVLLLGRVINTGMNETGLAGAMFFHEGFAEYAKYDPAQAASSLSPGDLLSLMFRTFPRMRLIVDRRRSPIWQRKGSSSASGAINHSRFTQSEGATGAAKTTLPAGTQYVVAVDILNRTIYYHTMFNRRVRKVNLEGIDFLKGDMRSFPLDAKRVEDVEEVTGKLR